MVKKEIKVLKVPLEMKDLAEVMEGCLLEKKATMEVPLLRVLMEILHQNVKLVLMA